MLAVSQWAVGLGIFLAQRLVVEWVAPRRVLRHAIRIMVEVPRTDDAESSVEQFEIPPDGEPCGTMGELVGIEPQPPDSRGADRLRYAVHDLVHQLVSGRVGEVRCTKPRR